ncbi:MAG: hypothetical protein GX952_05325 [Firmicutes bacterium]|nr:hypothetical protein [Bacillota bacterium]
MWGLWGSQDRADVWATTTMFALSMAAVVPFLWYHKRTAEALESIAESKERKTE